MHNQNTIARALVGGTAVSILVSMLLVISILPLFAEPIFSDSGQALVNMNTPLGSLLGCLPDEAEAKLSWVLA